MRTKVTGKGSAMSTQRIFIEYKGMLQSQDFKEILQMEMIKDNTYVWKLVFDVSKYEISKELKEDFQTRQKQYNLPQEISYEITFPDSYPHDPVFIRVLTPRFKYQTGHVTVGGSICMESLTPSGWTSARSLESYFIEILSLLNSGGARLDLGSNQAYTI
jgi:ubiquitin-conjugating enzyme E2 Q